MAAASSLNSSLTPSEGWVYIIIIIGSEASALQFAIREDRVQLLLAFLFRSRSFTSKPMAFTTEADDGIDFSTWEKAFSTNAGAQ